MLIGTDHPAEIHFVDEEIENSDTIQLLLAFTAGHPYPVSALGDSFIRRIGKLMLFGRKYDCPPLLSSCMVTLQHAADDRAVSPYDIFLVSAIMGDVALCSLAMTKERNFKWLKSAPKDDEKQKVFKLGVEGSSSLDVGSMPLERIRELPVDYAWALGRAFKHAEKWDERAKEFERLMGIIKSG